MIFLLIRSFSSKIYQKSKPAFYKNKLFELRI